MPGQVEQHALAQAAAADLQRLAERLRRRRRARAARRASAARAGRRGRSGTRRPRPDRWSAARARGARLSASSTSPTSRRSDAALPPTATATSTGGGRDRRQHAARRARGRPSSSAADGGSLPEVGVGQEARAERRTSADHSTPPVERADRDLGRAAADVDHRDAPRRAAARACAWRPGRPAAPPPRRRARRPRRRRARASPRRTRRGWRRCRMTAVATARIVRAPACSASASCSATTLAVSAIRAAGIVPPGASPRPRRVNARRCSTSREAAVARLGDQHAGGVRPDVDAAAEHSRAQRCCHDGSDDERRPRDRGHRAEQGLRLPARRCGASTSRSRAARSSACSAPTARARRPPSRCSRATARATPGAVRVLGHDPGTRSAALRARVGIVLQSCGTYPHLTVRETVEHWASLYPAPRRVDEVLALAGLDDCADRRARTLSRRPGAAAGLRARAGRRPRADLPRRADDGLRSRPPGAPPGT